MARIDEEEEIADRMERLASEYRLTVLGAEYNFWECTYEEKQGHPLDDYVVTVEDYKSCPTVLLSVETSSTPSRGVRVDLGSSPPLFAPDEFIHVYVDGNRVPMLAEL